MSHVIFRRAEARFSPPSQPPRPPAVTCRGVRVILGKGLSYTMVNVVVWVGVGMVASQVVSVAVCNVIGVVVNVVVNVVVCDEVTEAVGVGVGVVVGNGEWGRLPVAMWHWFHRGRRMTPPDHTRPTADGSGSPSRLAP